MQKKTPLNRLRGAKKIGSVIGLISHQFIADLKKMLEYEDVNGVRSNQKPPTTTY